MASALCILLNFSAVLLAIVASGITTQVAFEQGDQWGVEDVTANVGVLLRVLVTSRLYYVIDDRCTARLRISEQGKETLPSWLGVELDDCTKDEQMCQVYVEGVPGPEQNNQRYYISVGYITVCDISSSSGSNIDNADVFAIDVVNDVELNSVTPSVYYGERHPDRVYCHQGVTMTRAVVVIEANLARLSVSDRVAILRRFSRHLQLPVTIIQLLPSSKVNELGPGNTDHVKPLWSHLASTDTGATLQWTVGCGNVQAAYMSVLEQLERTAQDGTLSAAIGWPVLTWHVANQNIPGRHRPKRRLSHNFIQPTATPQKVTNVRPTTDVVAATAVSEAIVTSSAVRPTQSSSQSVQPTVTVAPFDGGAHHYSTKETQTLRRSSRLPVTREISRISVGSAQLVTLAPSIGSVGYSIPSNSGPTSPLPHSTTRRSRTTVRHRSAASASTPAIVKKPPKRTTAKTLSVTDWIYSTNGNVTNSSNDSLSTTYVDDRSWTPSLSKTPDKIIANRLTSEYFAEFTTSGFTTRQSTQNKSIKKLDDNRRPVKISRKPALTSTGTVSSITTTAIHDDEKLTTSSTVGETTTDFATSLLTSSCCSALTETIQSSPDNAPTDLLTSFPQTDAVVEHNVTATNAAESWKIWSLPAMTAEVVTSQTYYDEHDPVAEQLLTTAPRQEQDTALSSESLLTSRPSTVHTTSEASSTLSTVTPSVTSFATEVAQPNVYRWPIAQTSDIRTTMRPKKTRPTKKPRGRKRTVPPPVFVKSTPKHNSYAPVVKNPLGKLITDAGSIMTFPIANDTFIDFEDGGTSNLQLLLTNAQQMTLPPNSWIKLNASTQTLYGMPLDIHIGHHKFLLAAVNRHGKIVRTPFEVNVRGRPWAKEISHEVNVVINFDYQLFVQLVDKRLDVANKIGAVFNDRDPTRHIVVTKLTPGSVVYTWTNKSLLVKHRTVCPLQEITSLAGRIVHHDGSLNERFVRMMRPYSIKTASVVPYGPCYVAFQSQVDGDSHAEVTKPIEVQSRPKDSELDSFSYDNLLYILIPLVVLALILVILLVYVCYRELTTRSAAKNDHTKIPSSSSSSTALSSIRCASRGIPVIFAEELVDGNSNGGGAAVYPRSAPGVTADEKRVLPPPDYKALMRHNDWDSMLSSSDNKASDNKSLLISDDEYEDEQDTCHRSQGHSLPRYRADCRVRPTATEHSSGGSEQTSSRGLRPPLQQARYNGNSPPPPYFQSYVL